MDDLRGFLGGARQANVTLLLGANHRRAAARRCAGVQAAGANNARRAGAVSRWQTIHVQEVRPAHGHRAQYSDHSFADARHGEAGVCTVRLGRWRDGTTPRGSFSTSLSDSLPLAHNAPHPFPLSRPGVATLPQLAQALAFRESHRRRRRRCSRQGRARRRAFDVGGPSLCTQIQPPHPTIPIQTLAPQDLKLKGNRIGDDGVQVLAAAMCRDGGEAGSLPSLKLLNLSSNRVGDFGAKALANAMASGAMPSLGLLYLGSNRIGDAGLCALASASASASGLEQLYLEHNQIGCTGVTALADAATKLGATCRDKALSPWADS